MDTQSAEKQFQQAIQAGKARNYQECIDLLLELSGEGIIRPEISLYLGRSYHALGRYQLAVASLRDYHRKKPNSVAGMFFLGRAYFAAGQAKEALFQLKRALRSAPESAQIKTYLAFAYYRSGRHDLAITYFEELIQSGKQSEKVFQCYLNSLYIQAIRAFHRGESQRALEIFSYLQDQGVESVLLFLYLGMIYRELGELDTALKAYDRALDLAPDDDLIAYRKAVILKLMGREEEARDVAGEIDSIDDAEEKLDPVQADYRLAIRFYEEENYRKAAYYALRMIKAGSDSCDLRLLIGESFRRAGEFRKAENHFRRALDFDRSRVEARYGIAMLMWQAERFSDMLHVLKQIQHSDPTNEIASYYTPLVYWKQGGPVGEGLRLSLRELEKQPEDGYLLCAAGSFYLAQQDLQHAESYFEKAEHSGSASAEIALKGLISIHEEADKGGSSGDEDLLARLADDYRRLIKLSGEDEQLLSKLMMVLYRLGSYSSCADTAQKLLSRRGDDYKALRVLGIALRQTRAYEEAADIYRRLLRIEPYQERFIVSRAYCLDKAGKSLAAAHFLETAIDALGGKSYELHLILGTLFYQAKEYRRAEEVFRLAIQLSPSSWQAYQNLGMLMQKRNNSAMAKRYFSMANERR